MFGLTGGITKGLHAGDAIVCRMGDDGVVGSTSRVEDAGGVAGMRVGDVDL